MRNWYAMTLLALAALLAFTAGAGAQLYAIDNYDGHIYSYEDTVATVANPDTTLFAWARAAGLDHRGRLLIADDNDGTHRIERFDFGSQTFEQLAQFPYGFQVLEVAPDLGDDIYALVQEGGMRDEESGGRYYDDYLAIIRDGVGLPDTAYALTIGFPIDMAVRTGGPLAGNILLLMDDDGAYIMELERTESDSFRFYQYIADGGMMPGNATGIAVDPNGTIIILDYTDGLHYVEEEYDYVWGFGTAYGPGLVDLDIGSDGTIYVLNASTDRIERYDSGGYAIGSPFSQDLQSLGAIAVQGTVPTPEGEDVLVEPIEGIEITYEEVTDEGTTTAVTEETASRVSPEGNFLPDHAELPGTRATEFTYIGLSTDAVYRALIQVDVLEEGSRLFYADGVGDTFRDFTVVGSIDDARGTIPRFSEFTPSGGKGRTDPSDPTEVVLVEDTRALSEVSLYKFWRLELAMQVPDNMPGGDPCPWEFIEWLQKYPESARDYYDIGQYTNALSELAIMNGMIRSHAGWCIPDSSDDPLGNMVAKLLAHSKTLMFSIELESGEAFTGIDGFGTAISLAVTSPARGECRLALNGPVGAKVSASIYTVSGRLVATVYEGRLPEGGETVVWNGLDSTGRPIASGVYFAKVESGRDVVTSKVVYIR